MKQKLPSSVEFEHFLFSSYIFHRAPVLLAQSIFTISWSSFILTTNQCLLLKTGFWILQIFKPCFCKSFGIGYKHPSPPSASTRQTPQLWMKYEMFGFIFRSFFPCKIPEAVEWLAVYNVFKENIIVRWVQGVTGGQSSGPGRYNHSFSPQSLRESRRQWYRGHRAIIVPPLVSIHHNPRDIRSSALMIKAPGKSWKGPDFPISSSMEFWGFCLNNSCRVWLRRQPSLITSLKACPRDPIARIKVEKLTLSLDYWIILDFNEVSPIVPVAQFEYQFPSRSDYQETFPK